MEAYSEQAVREDLLEYFITQDPIVVRLRSPVFVDTAAGGRAQAGWAVRPEQTFYFQPFKRRFTQESIFNPQTYGEDQVTKVNYIMIGRPDVEWAVKDEFLVEVDTEGFSRLKAGIYRIEFIWPSHWDRRWAGVIWRGLQDAP